MPNWPNSMLSSTPTRRLVASRSLRRSPIPVRPSFVRPRGWRRRTICYDTIPALLDAFERFGGDDAAQRDPNCLAKSALAKTFYELDHLDATSYHRGIKFQQREPVWGGSIDTAVDACR